MSRGTVVVERTGSSETGAAPANGRRQELVDAAASIFLEKGYHATSVQDIAAALGILKGSVYYYIDSKEDLLYEIVSTQVERGYARIRKANRADGPLEALRVFFHLSVLDYARHPVLQPVAVREYRMLTGERAEVAKKATDRLQRFFRKHLTAGQRDGVICSDIPPALGARNLGTLHVGLHWAALAPNARNAERLAETYGDMAVASVACDPKRHRAGHRHAVGTTRTTDSLVHGAG